ncbi:MAG: RNA polymerase sigma factor [Acidimicrobiia bacterium]
MNRAGERRDDAELAGAAGKGDRRALEELLERHLDRVHAICRRILIHPEDALDATQEALIAVVRGISRFDGHSAFTTWLYRVVTNAALDEARRRQRRPRPLEVPPETTSSAPEVDSRVAARLDVGAALGRLSPEFRAAVVLRDVCDLDYVAIATILGVPVGTVRSRIARGRAALAEALGDSAHLGNSTPTPVAKRYETGDPQSPGRDSLASTASTEDTPDAHAPPV